ncbi:hypothetical protein M3_0207 [Lysinibacillus phage vB_LfM_LysYB1]|nr:hypothetical protein M3_0207 [Lysinibacillus phage vB_LfM_LysYB1]WAB25281.1 hypothetical protein M5_0103 [Lysinibacillus phage vB_LfM_LysYB2]
MGTTQEQLRGIMVQLVEIVETLTEEEIEFYTAITEAFEALDNAL